MSSKLQNNLCECTTRQNKSKVYFVLKAFFNSDLISDVQIHLLVLVINLHLRLIGIN